MGSKISHEQEADVDKTGLRLSYAPCIKVLGIMKSLAHSAASLAADRKIPGHR